MKRLAPLRLLLILVLAVILAEAVEISLLALLQPATTLLEAELDILFTTLLIFPFLYFFSFRPLLTQIEQRRRAEEALRQGNESLELRIQGRTAELLAANQALQEEILERGLVDAQLRLQTSAVEAADNGILITDPGGKIQWGNPAFTRMTGYTLAEIQGRDPSLLKSGAHDAEFYRTLWQTILTRQVWHGEIINRRKDGSLYTEEQTITPVVDEAGKLTHFIAIKQDISERKRAEQALDAERKRIFALLDELPATVYLKGADYSIRYANHHFRERFGDPQGAPCYRVVFRRDAPCEYCPAKTVFTEGRPVEWEQTFPDGRSYQLYDYPFVDADGSILTLELGIDITERKRAEARLEGTNRELKRLSRLLVEVQENERRSIARELHDEASQALTSLMVGLQLLEREADQSQAVQKRAAELRGVADAVLENLHRLAVDLRPASLDYLGLAAALRQYTDALCEQYELKIQLEILDLAERLPMEMETALYRIIQEALTNVMRHAQASRVGILIERRDGKVITIIEDDGVGFTPQSALESGRLGLFGMRERAEILGGQLTVESRPGSGTTIYVELPYADPHPDR